MIIFFFWPFTTKKKFFVVKGLLLQFESHMPFLNEVKLRVFTVAVMVEILTTKKTFRFDKISVNTKTTTLKKFVFSL